MKKASMLTFVTSEGPDAWKEVSKQCSGPSQSPVNIVTRRTLPDPRLTPFHLTGYQEPFDALLTNNGHTGKWLDWCFHLIMLACTSASLLACMAIIH